MLDKSIGAGTWGTGFLWLVRIGARDGEMTRPGERREFDLRTGVGEPATAPRTDIFFLIDKGSTESPSTSVLVTEANGCLLVGDGDGAVDRYGGD